MKKRKIRYTLACIIPTLLLAIVPSAAIGGTWLPSSGDWSVASNWSGSVPDFTIPAVVANGGTVNITEAGSFCSDVDLGYPSGSGIAQLSGSATLASHNLYVGFNGTGVFNQSGGTYASNVTGGGQLGIILGRGAGCNGTYNLSGSGIVSVPQDEYVGYNAGAVGTFRQSSGSNSTDALFVGTSGSYFLNGGTLQVRSTIGSVSVYGRLIGGAFINTGIFDGGNSPATMLVNNCTLDFTTGTWQNMGQTSIVMGTGSFTLVPAGFDTTTAFAGYTSLGLTHTVGTTLSVPIGANISGSFALDDPVVCQGSISAYFDEFAGKPGAIKLGGGLNLSGTAVLGTGVLTVNDSASAITAGYLQAPLVCVGSGGVGTFTQSSGAFAILAGQSGGTLSLGTQGGDRGTYVLSGGSLATYQSVAPSGTEYCGYSGVGAFTQSGGTNNCGLICLALNQGSSGSYNLNGGLLMLSSLVSGSGSAFFNFSGGTLKASVNVSTSLPMTLGAGDGPVFDTSNGFLSLAGPLSGPGSLTKTGSRVLSLSAINTYSGSTLVRSGTLALGNALALQNSTLDTSGSGVLSFESLTAATIGGLTGSGSLRLSNASSAAVNLLVGNNGSSTTFSGAITGAGKLTKVGSGGLLLSGTNSYIGVTTISSGTLQATTIAALPGYATFGRVQLGSGAMLAVSAGGNGWSAADITALLNNNNSNFTSDSTLAIDTSGGDLLYAPNISGKIGLAKLGTHSLTLSGTETYFGTTTVNQGELVVNGSLTSPVTVNNGGALGGTGSLSSVIVTSGGQLAPGNSPGTIYVAGPLTLSAGAVMDYELGSLTNADEVSMPGGTLNLNGQQFSDFNFTPLAGFEPGTYALVDAGSISGSLGANISGLINGRQATLAIQGNDLVLNVVPEPSSLVLVLAAVALWSVKARRRFSKRPPIQAD